MGICSRSPKCWGSTPWLGTRCQQWHLGCHKEKHTISNQDHSVLWAHPLGDLVARRTDVRIPWQEEWLPLREAPVFLPRGWSRNWADGVDSWESAMSWGQNRGKADRIRGLRKDNTTHIERAKEHCPTSFCPGREPGLSSGSCLDLVVNCRNLVMPPPSGCFCDLRTRSVPHGIALSSSRPATLCVTLTEFPNLLSFSCFVEKTSSLPWMISESSSS